MRREDTKLAISWLWGGIPVDVRALECEHGFANVETVIPLWGVAVGMMTAFLITPVAVDYACAGPPPLK